MIFQALLLPLQLLPERSTLCLRVSDLVMLRVDFAFPVTLHRSHLFLFGSKLFFERVKLLLKLTILLFDLVDMLLESGSFIV